MTFKSEDERTLLLAFIRWLAKEGWLKFNSGAETIVDSFLKGREIK